ncbi:hypothetical protein H0H87_006912 [Tephrocybe sp. NHM501043]|nr:hypothetical protein H0H87_006912 [Tephrocybe sp. NHM501043]
MEAALAEMALDVTPESMEDDVDFVNDKDEEDVFGSDFESTDEEAAQEDADAGDKTAQEEDKRARKDAHSRLERATAAAHARQKVTFNPEAEASTSTAKLKGTKRRVSLGVAFNAETGEVLPTATTPKKAKIESKTYTQAELIALALDNEEGNIVEHRDYLKVEEERRRRARVVRTAVEGPLVRWISKSEEIKVVVPAPPPPAFTSARAGYTYMPYGTMGSTPYGQSTPYTYSAGVYPHMATGGYTTGYTVAPITTAAAPTSSSSTSGSTAVQQPLRPIPQTTTQPTSSMVPRSTHSTATTPQQISTPPITVIASTPQPPASSTTLQTPSQAALRVPPEPMTQPNTNLTPQPPSPPAAQTNSSQPTAQINPYQSTHYNPYMAQLQSIWTPPPPPPPPKEKIETVTKNYVVHELAQTDGASKPLWNETMSAMFGDDVKWDELKVYGGKNRPLCMSFSLSTVLQCLVLSFNRSTSNPNLSYHRPTRELPGSSDRRSVRGRASIQGPDEVVGAWVCVEPELRTVCRARC